MSSILSFEEPQDTSDLMRLYDPQVRLGQIWPKTKAPPVRNYENSFELLERAARGLEFLQKSRGQLTSAFDALELKFNTAYAGAQRKGEEWQRLSISLRAQVQEYEKRLALAERRAEMAEAQAEFERQRAVLADQRASVANALSMNFHDKILSFFGQDSRLGRLLLALAKDTNLETRID